MSSLFALSNAEDYHRWRDEKLQLAPTRVEDLLVEISDPRKLTAPEYEAMLQRIRRANMVVYASKVQSADKDIARKLGTQFGLQRLNANWLAGEDGISEIRVSSAEDAMRQAYIPYTNKPIKWHTDGYYNTDEERIRGMILHCVHSAADGGVNRLLDHEMVYLLLREENPEFIRALSANDVMTIPPRTDEDGVARAEQSGPVFSVDENGKLHMRYTARTRSIEWKQDELSRAALAALVKILDTPSPYIYSTRLETGMGLLCNNVLHDRTGFTDRPEAPRLLYRARYFDRIANT